MRSDSKIPPIGTIINGRKYIGGLESHYCGGHKRNFITVKCMECGLESHIEAKGFRNYGCKCVRLKEKKWTKHGFGSKQNRNRFYEIFNGVKTRCNGTAGGDASRWYFDKGIKCEWNTFEEFKNDMYEAYLDHVEKYGEKQTSIDRLDPNGNYCKENCRRATIDEQSYNKSITNHVMIDGVKYDGKMLSELCGIDRKLACDRISKYLHGRLTYSNLLLKGNHKKDRLQATIDGKVYFVKDICENTGIKERTARRRFRDYLDGKISKEKLLAKKIR